MGDCIYLFINVCISLFTLLCHAHQEYCCFSTLLMVLIISQYISFAVIQSKQIHRTDQAIIMPFKCNVKSMPDEAGTDLHGTKG